MLSQALTIIFFTTIKFSNIFLFEFVTSAFFQFGPLKNESLYGKKF